jgi:MarR family transcriptional regulator, organic hydroperoxide resistance regulator
MPLVVTDNSFPYEGSCKLSIVEDIKYLDDPVLSDLVTIETKPKKPRGRRREGSRPDAATEAWTLVQRVFQSQRPRFMSVLREYDLVPPHWIALQALAEPMPMGELAKVMVCDNSNITWITDRLEERGLVERTPAERDRRVKLLVLTAEGRRVREEIEARLTTPPPAIKNLSRADQQVLRTILRRVTAGLQGS